MKLIPCPVCTTQVSSAAASCPRCGHPLQIAGTPQGRENFAGKIILVVILVIAAAILLIGASPAWTVLMTDYH